MIRINSPKDFPTDHKFLIMIFSTSFVHHEADRRSIEAPGHGFPAYDEPVHSTELKAIKDKDELQRELNTLYSRDKNRTDILVLEIGRVISVGVSVKVDLG